MVIGIVTTWYERGAAYVSRQYRALLEGSHRVEIYARAGERPAAGSAWDDPAVTRGVPSLLPVATAVVQSDFSAWLDRVRPDLVLFNEQQWWPPVQWCRERGIATCAYVDYYTEESVPLFAAYDLLLCNTRRHHEAFAWHPGALYLPWGTDLALFAPAGTAAVSEGRVSFFHSAGMSPRRKGTDQLLQAFGRVTGPKRLVLHGQVDLRRALPECAGILDALEAAGELILVTGTVPAPGCYHLGDVYVYPTRLEGIGLTVAEALACGLPVIVPDNPPMNEFVAPGCGRTVAIERLFSRYDGYYWPQCEVSIESLAEAMQWYLDRATELPALKAQARAWAEERLDWSRNREALLRTLAGLVRHSRPMDREIAAFEWSRARGSQLLRLYCRWPGAQPLIERLCRLRRLFSH